MAASEIDKSFLIAGHEYGEALASLGLDPEALFWAFDQNEDRHVLVLVTDFFDLKGPLEISKQLFKAYNASATPREIDPFVVRLHSINQPIGRQFADQAKIGPVWKFKLYDSKMRQKELPVEARATAMTIAGLEMRPDWIIRARTPQHRKTVELNRRWNRFTRNLEKAAA